MSRKDANLCLYIHICEKYLFTIMGACRPSNIISVLFFTFSEVIFLHFWLDIQPRSSRSSRSLVLMVRRRLVWCSTSSSPIIISRCDLRRPYGSRIHEKGRLEIQPRWHLSHPGRYKTSSKNVWRWKQISSSSRVVVSLSTSIVWQVCTHTSLRWQISHEKSSRITEIWNTTRNQSEKYVDEQNMWYSHSVSDTGRSHARTW